MHRDHIRTWVAQHRHLVTMSSTPEGWYAINYTPRVTWRDLWSPEMELMRGVTVDRHFRIISAPFRKIYTYGVESRAPTVSDDAVCDVHRKWDGVPMAVSQHRGRFIITHMGHTQDQWTERFGQVIDQDRWHAVLSQWPNHTVWFEWVTDASITRDPPGIYCVARRENTWSSQHDQSADVLQAIADELGIQHTPRWSETFGELKHRANQDRTEGYVFRTADTTWAKLKTSWYLTQTFLHRWGASGLAQRLNNDNILATIDPQFKPLVLWIRARWSQYCAMTPDERIQWIAEEWDLNNFGHDVRCGSFRFFWWD